MNLNSEQKKAVEYLEGPLLVLAGPGTGKTQLLSAKVAYILENTDSSPDNILCVTFTDSGCQNMRDRLASIIGAIPASKVNIRTYHTLGTDILYAYKNYSETYNRNLDSAIDEITQFKIIKTIQKSLPASDILRDDNTNNIISAISEAKAHRLSAEDLAMIAKINQAESEAISKAISPLLEKITPRKLHPSLEEVFLPIAEILENSTPDTDICKGVNHTILGLKTTLASALSVSEEKDSISPLTTGWVKKMFEKQADGSYRTKDYIANKKLASLAVIMKKYEEHLEKEGLYDFNDMIEEAITALKTDTGFRLTLSERFQFILLDEFQDTNPSQFEIIKLLTDYEKPCIMAVGDDDQAIYEFQGANASNLKIFKDHYDAKVINLVTNYRSTQDILDFSKQIIDQVDDSFAKTEKNIEKNLTAFFKDKKGSIERHEFLSSNNEYYWISEKISALVKSGVPQTDIAILTAKHKYIPPLLPYLRTHPELNISYEKTENILDDPCISELITLARFADDLSDGKLATHHLPRILSFPFWKIDALTVVETLRAARISHLSALDCLKNSPNKDLNSLAKFFADLAVASLNAPLELFMSYLIGTAELNGFKSPFLDFYSNDLTSFDTFDLFEKLTVLKSKTTKHLKNTPNTPKLKDLLQMLDDYELAEKSIENTSPYQDSNNAISILSAHKAKGLEFKHVFILSADNSSWGQGKGNNNQLVLPKNLQHIRHTGATDSERLRLLFVAITRAENYLYITNSLKDFNEKSATRLSYLNESEQKSDSGETQLISPFIPKDSEKIVKTHYSDPEQVKLTSGLETNWLNSYLKTSPEIFSLYQKTVENYQLSPTALSNFIDVVYGGPKEFFKRQVLKFPGEPTSYSLALGNLTHRTFEKITKEKITDDEAIEFFKAEAKREDVDDEIRTELLEKVPLDLAVSLKAFGNELRAPFTRAELDFRSEKLTFSGVPLTGKIDHIKINEEEKTIEVFDFKTSKYKDGNWGTSDVSLYKYSLQLNFYKLLLNLSPNFKNYKIKTAHILFVTPDKDGLVYDKVYEYNEKDEAHLKSLIPKVYTHMKSLDFLENPDFMFDPDKTKKLADIMSFIDLL